MKHKIHKRAVAVLLLLALLVGVVPAAIATDAQSSVEPAEEEPIASGSESAENPVYSPDSAETEDDVPRSMDGETLTRDESLLKSSESSSSGGLSRSLRVALAATSASSTGTMSKSTCVDFAAYTSPTWYCNRYTTEGTHTYGHYYYTSTIAYHTIGGEFTYCIEPNTTSLDGQTYTCYDADSASSSSYWMLELDATQRSYIQQIMAFGYPSIDRGYSTQVQYAATQTLIWEVVSKCRYSSVKSCSDYGLYNKVYAVLGANYKACYEAIVSSISVYSGIVPSFASTNASSPSTVTLTYNSDTDCYEGSAYNSTLSAMSYYTFSYPGVSITRRGNFIDISVPSANAASIKGKTITGVSSQMNMDTSNPTIWENSTYQTVLSSGGAEYMKVYINILSAKSNKNLFAADRFPEVFQHNLCII